MQRFIYYVLIVSLLAAALPAQTGGVTLTGAITDPSGALVPGATVILRGPGGTHRAAANASGQYSFTGLKPAKYTLRAGAQGFAVATRNDIDLTANLTLNLQLEIAVEATAVDVQDDTNTVSTDTASNGTGLVLGKKELDTLSDDPDELQQQLQAMADPGAGPSGGQIYIDGFTGGDMPAKSSILQVKINSNPYAPEYDRPGFGRIEIITKPGANSFHGQAFVQYNGGFLDSRNPLLQQSSMPPYAQKFFGLTFTGPIKKDKASFTFDGERRNITENAFVYATTLDSSLQQNIISEGIVTPQTRTSLTPRIDYSINSKNTLTLRYQATRVELDKEDVGGFVLPSAAFNQHNAEDTVQLTETAILSPTAIAETRFQFLSSRLEDLGGSSALIINVAGAFQDGGSPVGASSTISNRWELNHLWTVTHGTHTFKWGGRARESFLNDTSLSNFAGTFTFLGGFGPELDAENQAIPGAEIPISALEVYRRTLLFEQMGYTPQQIAALGGGATQFTLNAGTPLSHVTQFDAGLFANDDWKMRPNLTLSYGLRYETQTNIRDYNDWSPRLALAWGIDGHGATAAKTVLRAGFGVFYDRIADTDTLAAERYNGITQQSYFIRDPTFFPVIPALSQLSPGTQQSLQYLEGNVVAPRNYQASVGVDRQFNRYFRLGAQFVSSRGVHLERQVNINSPLNGVYPFGDSEVRLLTETVGFSRSNMLVLSPNLNYKKLFLFGFYMSSWGKDDNEGLPADPYNLRAEWGPSSFADIHQRLVLGTSLPLPKGISLSPFFIASSGAPFNITTGIDSFDTGFATARPALETGVSASSCTGTTLVYAAGYGCFNLDPSLGSAVIARNYGRGPGQLILNLRLSKTFGFGGGGESGMPMGSGPPPGMGGARGGPSGPPPGGGGPGGPPRGMFGPQTSKRYNLTLSAMAQNAINHPNYGTPSGDLSSPFFGEPLTLAGFGPFGAASRTYNRKIDLQVRLTF